MDRQIDRQKERQKDRQIWVKCNDPTATSLGIIVNVGNHPQMTLIQVCEKLYTIYPDGQIYRQIDGWIDRHIDRWINGWIERQMGCNPTSKPVSMSVQILQPCRETILLSQRPRQGMYSVQNICQTGTCSWPFLTMQCESIIVEVEYVRLIFLYEAA